MTYRIRNWRKFQHFKDRRPPWIKVHFEKFNSLSWVHLNDLIHLRRLRYNGGMLMVIYNLIKAMFSGPRGYFHMWITISNAGAFSFSRGIS